MAQCKCGADRLPKRKTCRPCYNAYMRDYYRRKPHKARAWTLKRRRGISLADYDKMLERQGGGCAVCGGQSDPGFSLAVDHNHATGEVRGLLCSNCNRGLGLFKDDPHRLRAAAAYLAGTQCH